MDIINCDVCKFVFKRECVYCEDHDYYETNTCKRCMIYRIKDLSNEGPVLTYRIDDKRFLCDRMFELKSCYYDVEAMTEEQVDGLDDKQKITAKAYLKQKKESDAIYKELEDWKNKIK